MGDVEDDHRWEDAIDVDDSDLLLLPRSSSSSSSYLPPLRPCSQTLTLTPTTPNPPPPKPSLAAAGPASSWTRRRRSGLYAPEILRPLRRCRLASSALGEHHAASVRRIGSIKTSSIDRIPYFKKLGDQVVGVVKSCTPNGLGDLFLTLKDPTGMIGAFVHRKVISDGNLGGGISVGCVLILKQVVVFCPARSVCYLNVTINNIVKLFTKDCGPCHKQVISSFTARSHIAAKHMKTNLEQQSERDALMRRRIETGNACIEETSTSWAFNDLRPSLNDENVMGGKETSSTAAAGLVMSNPNHEKNEAMKHISRVSTAQWTDEQLSELFADY
uniref:Homologous recombination OB-fold protein OB-fold domain-containing protein n=1 Tax=Ananas comosus var. bracteatus TaxID=296719 RepID=A0A6V7NGS8_ANACO|nr:unnamed protein product [Ananas comosus var. bracteatus]